MKSKEVRFRRALLHPEKFNGIEAAPEYVTEVLVRMYVLSYTRYSIC